MKPPQGPRKGARTGERNPGEEPARYHLRTGLQTSIVDNSTAFGFSITVTCSFGALNSLHGSPTLGRIFGFGLAAAATFTLLQALSSDLFRRRPETAPREVVMLGTALNFLSVGLGVGAATLVGLVVGASAAWPLAGAAASAAYVLTEALEIVLAEMVERRRGLVATDEGG